MRIQCDFSQPLSADVRSSVRELAAAKLQRFVDVVRHVRLIVQDQNGPKGGVDTSCLVRIHLQGLPEVIVRRRSDRLAVAVGECLERAVRAVARLARKQVRRSRGADRHEPQWQSALA